MMMTCNLLLDHDSQIFKIFLLVVRTGLPVVLIVYFYVRIYLVTYDSRKRLLSTHDLNNRGPFDSKRLFSTRNDKNTSANPLFSRRHVNNRVSLDANLYKKEMHLTRMMSMIFLLFAVSYFPCTITGIIDWNHVMSKTFHMFCATTVYIGSAFNPVLYGLLNRQFRKSFVDMVQCFGQVGKSTLETV